MLNRHSKFHVYTYDSFSEKCIPRKICNLNKGHKCVEMNFRVASPFEMDSNFKQVFHVQVDIFDSFLRNEDQEKLLSQTRTITV